METLQGSIDFNRLVVPLIEIKYQPRVELTKMQKDWIRERDDHECQFPISHICHGMIQLHHILAMGFGLSVEGLTPQEINKPENIISICENIHIGDPQIKPDPNLIHPDHRHAKMDYRQGDLQAFEKVGKQHRLLMSVGLRYWNAQNDSLLTEVVQDRMYKKRNMASYPKKRGD